jgi:drug/metabolite transporter (DMT)-like permease
MLSGCVVFAVMGALTHRLAHNFGWQVIATARAFIPFAVVAGISLAAGTRLVLWRPGILWMRSIAGSISLICCFYCFTRIAPSLVLTVTNVFPLWIALLSWPLEKEKPAPAVWLATLTGVAGVFVIQRPGTDHGIDQWAVMLAVIASLCTAVAMMGLHRLQHLETNAIVVHFSGVALVFAVTSWIVGGKDVRIDAPEPWMWLGLIGIGLTATIGQFCLTKAFTAGPPTKVAIVALSQIVFAMILDVTWLDKHFDAVTLLGVGLVLAPTAWVVARRLPVAPKELDLSLAPRLGDDGAIETSPYTIAAEPEAVGEGS